MAENTNTERADFEAWAISQKLGEYTAQMGFRYHDAGNLYPAWQAWQARASLSLPAAGQEPVAADEWKVRGYLAATLKCWHRLTDEEATELVAMTLRLSGLYPAPQPAPPTEQQAYDMGAKGAPATDAERLLFEAWMRGHCWALCATWDGKSYRSDAEQNGNIDPRAMNTRQLWAAWRDRAALAAPQPAVAAGWMPMQPIVWAKDGCIRFLANRMVNDLYEFACPRGMGLNEMAAGDYTQEERMQFAQLIGYSVSGYGGLSYVSDESRDKADAIADALPPAPSTEGESNG